MLVERGLQVMNVEAVGEAYAIASNYLRRTGAIADTIARQAPLAVQATLRSARANLDHGPAAALADTHILVVKPQDIRGLLAEIGPLIETLELGGTAQIRRASMHGPFGHPKLTADVTLESFVFAGFLPNKAAERERAIQALAAERLGAEGATSSDILPIDETVIVSGCIPSLCLSSCAT